MTLDSDQPEPNQRLVFDQLLEAAYSWTHSLAYLLCSDRAAAEDLAHETLERAITKAHHISRPDVLRAWLRTTMLRLLVSRRRRAAREARAFLRILWTRGPGVDLSEPALEMWMALRGLPPRQRACIALRYLEDLPENEIAAVLKMKPGTVKAHLAQGRKRLRTVLERSSLSG